MTRIQKILLIAAALLVVILIFLIFISPVHAAQDFTQCSFYIENGTCTQMSDKCTNQVTEMLKGMNFGLQDELEVCEAQVKPERFSKIITIISISLLIIFLIKDSLRKRKEKKR